jgi:hypothetical protein
MNYNSRSQYRGIVRIIVAGKENLCLLGLVGFYAVTRLYNLRLLPIFLDEATHIEWSLAIWQRHGLDVLGALNRPLADGKFLQILLLSLVSPWAPDPLWGSRLVSVLGGAVTLCSCYAIGKRLYGIRVGLVSALLYILCPFGLFYDRMALADSFLCAGAAFTLWAAIALVQERSCRYCLALSASLGLTPLFKATGVIVFFIPLLCCLLLAGPGGGLARLRKQVALAYAAAIACIGAIYVPSYLLGVEKPLRMNYHYLAAFSKSQGISGLLRVRWDHVREAATWTVAYITPPIVIVAMFGLILAVLTFDRKALLLGSAGAILFCSIPVLFDLMFPRYLIWTTGPWVVLAAATVVQLSRAVAGEMKLGKIGAAAVTGVCLLFVCIPAVYLDDEMLRNVRGAQLPAVDRAQYIEGWPSGYGVEEAAGFLKKEAGRSPGGLIVACSESGGNSQVGIRVLLSREKKIRIEHLLVRGDAAFGRLEKWAGQRTVYVVFEQPPLGRTVDEQPDVERLGTIAKRIEAYVKPGGGSAILVYRLSLRSEAGR